MDKRAETTYPIHELLQQRWSPRAFSPRPVEDDALRSLFEAARWAPSSSNEQPWSFLVTRRDETADFERLLRCLSEGNRRWASAAPVLVLAVARLFFESDGRTNRHALYDVGQAVASLAIQATALGLSLHQMAGFDVARAREELSVPEGHEPVTVIAVGYRGDPESLPDRLRERELARRSRKALATFVFSGSWGRPSALVSRIEKKKSST
jgi:nitroreductase